MKAMRFFLLMFIGAGLLQGTSLASQPNSASQQTPAPRSEASAGDSSDAKKDGQVRSERDQTGVGDSGGERNSPERGTRHLRQHRLNRSDAKPAPTYQVRPGKTPATNNLRSEMAGNSKGFQQRGSTPSIGLPHKMVNDRSVPVPPPTVAVNGQQFKNSRDPGARLTVSGGPLTATRGTAAINGTDMKRKP